MGNNLGSAESSKGMGRWGDFSGRVNQLLWPALKSAVEKGELNLNSFSNDPAMRSAIRRGFLAKEREDLITAGLHIGKVTKEELDGLSIWGRKNLYEIFYQRVFGLYLRFPDHLMPEAPDEFSWPVCIPGVISNEIAFQSGKLNIPRWKWTDKSLDNVLDLSRGRDAWTHSYVIRVRPNWEADEDLKNLSANDIEKKNLNVAMLRERLILGTFLFWLTGDHLDRKTVTLTGSRDLDGRVLSVRWDADDKLHVGWYVSCDAYPLLRARQVVS